MSGARGPWVLGGIIASVLIVGGLIGTLVHAQFGTPWRRPPKVVVVGAAGDPRARLVDEAVSFWNKTLAEIGSGFRLGPVTHIIQQMSEETLRSMSQSVLMHGGGAVPPALQDPPGDITVFPPSRSSCDSPARRMPA